MEFSLNFENSRSICVSKHQIESYPINEIAKKPNLKKFDFSVFQTTTPRVRLAPLANWRKSRLFVFIYFAVKDVISHVFLAVLNVTVGILNLKCSEIPKITFSESRIFSFSDHFDTKNEVFIEFPTFTVHVRLETAKLT